MNLLQYARIACPCCGETIEITVDTSVSQQAYIEDCAVCCQPISLQLICSPGDLLEITAHRENDAS